MPSFCDLKPQQPVESQLSYWRVDLFHVLSWVLLTNFGVDISNPPHVSVECVKSLLR